MVSAAALRARWMVQRASLRHRAKARGTDSRGVAAHLQERLHR